MSTAELATATTFAPVNTREELIYLLSRASELEHGLACVYLFTGYSLKTSVDEGGMNAEEAAAVQSWKRKLAHVAVEEMLHLAQVSNMLTAIGGAPHFKRSNFPMRADAFPLGIELTLEPFSQSVIERLLCFEMPEEGVLSPERHAVYETIRARVAQAVAARSSGPSPSVATEPFDIDFATVGEFYHKIESGFQNIAEDRLFIGPREAQAKAQYLDLDRLLISVVDRSSACAAIEMIVEQGESPTSDHPDAHFTTFDGIRLEFEALVEKAKARGEVFDPVRPIVPNPMTRYFDDATGGSIIDDPLSHDVADLFNTTYDTMLLMLLRFFAHVDENEEELRMMARGTLRMMASVLRPMGEALAKMPAGPSYQGENAGPGFGYNRDVHLLPHKESAWIFLTERLVQLTKRTSALAANDGAPPELAEAAAALQSVTDHLLPYATRPIEDRGELFGDDDALGASISPEPNGPYIISHLRRMTNSKGEVLRTRPKLALCRCGGSSLKPYCDGTHATIGFQSAKAPDRTPDKQDRYDAEGVTVLDNRGTCCHFGNCTDQLPSVFHVKGEPFVDPAGASPKEIIDIVRACPSGALSYVEDGVEYAGEDRDESIYVSQNGPYYVRGGIALEHVERNEGALTEHYALCRCGHSKNKPFCDGSHWYVGFKDEDN